MSQSKLDSFNERKALSNIYQDEHQKIMQLLKRYLHQNNLSLYCFQNQNNQTLLDVIADYLSLKKHQLHTLLVTKFKQMLRQQSLPKRLMNVYSDTQIISQYQKDPQLVSFYKITYELVSAVYQVKIIIYTLLQKSDKNFVLNAMIVNPKGAEIPIQLARVGNSFYRVQQQFHQQDQFSLPSMQSYPSAKSSNNLNSQEKQQKQFSKMRQPFKSEQIIVDIASQQQMSKTRKLSPDYASLSGDHQHMEPFSPIKLVKNKSVNFQQKDFLKNQSIISQYGDDVSLGSILDKEQQKELLNTCSNVGKETQVNSGQKVNLIHQNNHMPGNNVMSPEMMYYYYLNHQGNYVPPGYPGKSQPYLPYAGHSISPSKNPHKVLGINTTNSPVKPSQPFSPLYPSQQSQDTIVANQPTQNQVPQTPPNAPLQIKQGQRYKGRLKFFDEGKNYGFIIMDADQSDLFVHFDDLHKAGITKQKLKTYKQNEGYMQVKFTFKVMQYFGKYRQSRKAVELQVMQAP